MPGLPALRGAARQLQSYGRNGDTMLAHITPDEAALLKRRGGAGTRNPVTGLPEYWSENNSAEAGQGHANSGAADGDYGGGYGADNMMDTSRPAAPITEERDIETHPSHRDAPPVGAPVNDAMFSVPGFVPGSTAINAIGLAMANPNIRSFDEMTGERQGFNIASAFMGGGLGALGGLATSALTSLLGPPERDAETAEESSASPNNSVGGNTQPGGARAGSMLPRAMWEQRFMAVAGKHPSQASRTEWEQAMKDPLLSQGYGMANGGPVYMNEGGSVEDAIRSYYQSFLGRDPDADGLGYYTNAANSGISLDDIQRMFLNSPEYGTRVQDAIRSYYQTFLGRDPDADGMGYYANAATSGTPLNEIQRMFLNSPEYATRQEIERYYANNYGLAPTTQQMQEALGLGLRGQELGASLASKASEEERVRAINNAYQTYFGREAEPDGLNWWLRDWDIVTKDGSVLDDILRGAQNDDQWAAVNRLGYQDLLGREGEEAGREFWTRPDIYKEITEGGLEDLRASILAGAQNDDRDNAIRRSYDLLFNREVAPVELQGWLDNYQEAALQGLRRPIAESAQGDDRQRLTFNADTGMFNPMFTLDKTPGEVFRDYVVNKPENALGTSTYLKSADMWDAPPQEGWKNPNVVPDDYFPEPFKAATTGVGDLTWGFEGTGGFSADEFRDFEEKARVGTQTTQNLLDERFGVNGQPGNFPFAEVSVPPPPGSLGPGSLGGSLGSTGGGSLGGSLGSTGGVGSNRVPSGTGESPNYIPPSLRDETGGYRPPAGGWPFQQPTPPTGQPISRDDYQGGTLNFPNFGYTPYTPPSVTLNYLQGPIYRYAPDLTPQEVRFIDMQGMAGGGPVRMAIRRPQGLAALR